MKLSDHFDSSEFVKGGKLSAYQAYLATCLAVNILEPVRTFLSETTGKKVSIKILNGVRTLEDVERIKSQGYFPAAKSDHYYGLPVRTSTPADAELYGEYYTMSVGAVDFLPSISPDIAFSEMMKYAQVSHSMLNLPNAHVQVGQLILERGKYSYWIHVSNNPNIVYNGELVDTFLKRQPFLISNDNGKTYQPWR